MKIRRKYLSVIFSGYKKYIRIGTYEHNITIAAFYNGITISVQCGYKYFSKTF